MEVLLKVPEDLVKYIEYIPYEVLPGVLVDIIRRDILGRHDKVKTNSAVNFSEIVKLLEQAQNVLCLENSSDTKAGDTSLYQNCGYQAEEPLVLDHKKVIVNPSDSQNELGDLMDLLK